MNAKAGTVKERLFPWAVFKIMSKTYKIIVSLVLSLPPTTPNQQWFPQPQ